MTLKPKRQLNLLQTSSIIIGQVIGSGIFINIPIVAAIAGNSWIAVFIWFLGGLLWLPQIFILAEMGTAYPDQGGPYHFIHKAGSPFLAFIYTWTAFLTSDTPTLTIIGLLAADALSFFFPELGLGIYAKIFAAVLIAIFTVLQYRSVKSGGNVQVVLTFAKLFPLLAVVIIGFFFIGDGNLYVESLFRTNENKPISLSIITAGVAATIWAYAGFLNILYTSGEVKNPTKNLPKALIGSVLFVMGAYVLISFFTNAIVPFNDLISVEEGKFINPFKYIQGISGIAGGIFAVAVFVSMLGVMNSSIITQPRLEYAMAKDGLFFKRFATLHPKFLTPSFSIVFQSVFAVVLLFGNLNDLLGYFTLSYVLQNTLVYGSIFWLHKKEDYKPTYKSPVWKIMGGVSVLVQLYLAYGAFLAFPLGGLLACLSLIFTGLPLYLYFKREKSN
ncbi:MAG: amino acid permease [Bacteroidetes bacterium]|nr:amino acid permease [Bacteroidota bacterium]MBU1114803.1 amino acid permease [Bacteroidota bacterium]MBU1796995.1 amino acid permease [Bacteroidota bacterium]